MIDLQPMARKQAQGLTADQKQKISLGRGLVRSDVNAILFDEPLTVIDPHMKWVLRSQLKRLHRQSGFTMVYVTHDQTEALTFADKVVVMYDGQIVQIGTPAELFERPSHTFVGYFIGSPGMNVMPVKVNGADRDRWRPDGEPAGRAQSRPDRARSNSASARNIVRLGRDGMPVTVSQGRGCRPPQDRARASWPAGTPRSIVIARGCEIVPADPKVAVRSPSRRQHLSPIPGASEMEGMSHGQDLEQQGLVPGACRSWCWWPSPPSSR